MKFLRFLQNLLSQFTSIWNYFWHKMRSNSLDGSRRNISEHYDEGNEMFRLFLDPSMTYSCAIFNDEYLTSFKENGTVPTVASLYEAQLRKYDRAIWELGLQGGGEKILEIGCGWGSCAIHAAARHSDCRWTALTISQEQFRMARERVQLAGLEGKICIKFADYRQESGLYDHIVAIEMVEAVGHEYLPTFFETCSKLLKPGGRIFLQAIVCPEEAYECYRRSSDFIKKHIFPGGNLPSVGAIRDALPNELQIIKLSQIGANYSPTLDAWRCAWVQNRDKVLAMGYTEKFFRKWDIYFSLCSALFAHKSIDVVHLIIEKKA